MRTAAPTFDEVAHIGAAHDYVARGAYVLNRAHPPFTKQLAGLGLRRLELVGRAPEPPPPGTADDALHWFREQWTCGRALLFGQAEHRPMAVLNAARLPLLLLGLPLILGIGLWVRAIGGEAAAATSIALLALSPSLIAHARLVHNDFAVAVFMILALALAFRLRDGAAAGGVAALAIVVTLALASKYAALLLGPMLVAAVISDIVLLRRGRIALGRWFVVGGAVAVVALFGLSFSTGRFDPGHWWGGLSIFLGDTRTGYEIYCRGRFDADGFWYYFPLLLAVKMPGSVAPGCGVAVGSDGSLSRSSWPRMPPSRSPPGAIRSASSTSPPAAGAMGTAGSTTATSTGARAWSTSWTGTARSVPTSRRRASSWPRSARSNRMSGRVRP